MKRSLLLLIPVGAVACTIGSWNHFADIPAGMLGRPQTLAVTLGSQAVFVGSTQGASLAESFIDSYDDSGNHVASWQSSVWGLDWRVAAIATSVELGRVHALHLNGWVVQFDENMNYDTWITPPLPLYGNSADRIFCDMTQAGTGVFYSIALEFQPGLGSVPVLWRYEEPDLTWTPSVLPIGPFPNQTRLNCAQVDYDEFLSELIVVRGPDELAVVPDDVGQIWRYDPNGATILSSVTVDWSSVWNRAATATSFADVASGDGQVFMAITVATGGANQRRVMIFDSITGNLVDSSVSDQYLNPPAGGAGLDIAYDESLNFHIYTTTPELEVIRKTTLQ